MKKNNILFYVLAGVMCVAGSGTVCGMKNYDRKQIDARRDEIKRAIKDIRRKLEHEGMSNEARNILTNVKNELTKENMSLLRIDYENGGHMQRAKEKEEQELRRAIEASTKPYNNEQKARNSLLSEYRKALDLEKRFIEKVASGQMDRTDIDLYNDKQILEALKRSENDY